MARILYFFERKDDSLAAELERAGHTVVEVLNFFEALTLINTNQVDIAIISPEARAHGGPIHGRILTISLYPKSTAQEVIRQLAENFPGPNTREQ
jgi:hypothetical protein